MNGGRWRGEMLWRTRDVVKEPSDGEGWCGEGSSCGRRMD